ncbi:MAG: cytochrome c-type biosis protein CcmH [Sphingomonadales bacterium]|jgi:cytochrome c-type biogenesis protein CcmH|nr:cytochrome c-type biosis protein CcmH [Sphingomonadales bacterium]
MAEPAPKDRRPAPATIALALAALIAAGALFYSLVIRRGDAAAAGNAAAAANITAAAPQDVARVEEMMAGLMRRVRENPDDHEGWFLLGMAYRAMERFAEATQAFRRAMELQPRNPDYTAYLAEMILIGATSTGGPPPPEAGQLFRRALTLQPGNPQARFYLATIRNERGDHRGAVDDLLALLRDAPADAAWPQQVRSALTAIAQRNNIDLAGRLPAAPAAPPPSIATAAIPGPTAEQLRAASGMTPSQQDAAGRAMVNQLAARLRASPRDERRWIMLMRSRTVLQDRNGAADALRTALGVFQNDAAAQARLRQAARELAIPGG